MTDVPVAQWQSIPFGIGRSWVRIWPRHTKGVKMVPVATLLGAQHYKASTGFSSPNKYRTTNIATLTNIKKVRKSLIIINVCIHRRAVWKTGNYAKYVILLKYRDYYYYHYYVCQQQIYRLFAIDRRLSAAHFPNICY